MAQDDAGAPAVRHGDGPHAGPDERLIGGVPRADGLDYPRGPAAIDGPRSGPPEAGLTHTIGAIGDPEHGNAARPDPVPATSTEPGPAEPIRLGDTTVSLSVLRATPEAFAQLYERTKATVGFAECLCTLRPQRLVIRTRLGRFHLACWPGQRGLHAERCHFHQLPAHLTGRSRYTAAAFEEDIDGVRIRLGVPLTLSISAARRQPVQVVPGAQAGTTNRNVVTLLGLVHHLWERSALNRWPGRRHRRGWRECTRYLAEAIDETRLGDIPLAAVLYMVPAFTRESAAACDAEFDRFISQLGRHGRLLRRGLVLAEIRELACQRPSCGPRWWPSKCPHPSG